MDIQDDCINLDRADIIEHFTTYFQNSTEEECDLFFEEYTKEFNIKNSKINGGITMTNEIIARLAWKLSEEINDSTIASVSEFIAEKIGLKKSEYENVKISILEGLKEISEKVFQTKHEQIFGYVSDLNIYWWDNNAETRWTSDEPDWLWYQEDVVKYNIEQITECNKFISAEQFTEIQELAGTYSENCGSSGTGKGILYTIYLTDEFGNQTETYLCDVVVEDEN